MGPYSVETGWGEAAMRVLEGMTPARIAKVAGPASDVVASRTSDPPRFVLERGSASLRASGEEEEQTGEKLGIE